MRLHVEEIGTDTFAIPPAPALIRAAESALTKAARGVTKDLQRGSSTWQKKPKWQTQKHPGVRDIITHDKVYVMVNEGTPPHIIVPRRKRFLSFRLGFQAKTQPNVLDASAGAKAGGAQIFTAAVHHPGFKAREFTKEVQALWNRNERTPQIVQRELDAVITEGA